MSGRPERGRPADGRRRVAIVGAGPQALTAAVYLVAAGVPADELVVLDPTGHWLARWRQQFAHMGIAHLRSPAVHHPHPDPYALSKFAAAGGRSDELRHRYGLPTTQLFADFCDDVIEGSGLADAVRRAEVVAVTAEGRLTLAGGSELSADHVIWATNPAVAQWEAPGGVGIVPWYLADLAAPPPTVAVVGGGLTAAHLVERALERGCHVEWVARRPIVERDFDTDSGWLGPKHMQAFAALANPVARLERVLDARGGGTVPGWMMRRLRPALRAGRLCLRTGRVELASGAAGVRPAVRVEGAAVHADVVWAATGDRPCTSAAPPLHRLCEEQGVEIVAGRPVLDRSLRLPGSAVHVVGRLAQLQLGPTAGNLAGARRAAERLVGAVVGLTAMYALVDA